METKFKIQENGQEVRTTDIESVSTNAARADDRVLQELFRLVPYNSAGPTKYVWTYGVDTWAAQNGDNSTALVHPDPSAGRLRVRAFRAAVSSLDTSSNLERVRGIRSGYHLPGSTSGFTVQSLTANGSSDPRWTLLFAALTPDTNGDTATVLKQSVSSGTVSPVSVVLNTKTTVTLDTVNGTPAASPTYPTIPADAAGVYYIPLAYILIPGSFNSATILDPSAIYEVAPVVTLNTAVGGLSSRPANQQWAEGGTVDTNQSGSDAAASTYRPGAYLPSTMVGAEERVILIQNHLPPLSHSDGDVVDDSCDWRFRYFEWTATAETGNTVASAFPSDRNVTGTNFVSSAWNADIGVTTAVGVGQSFVDDTTKGAIFSVSDGNGAACVLRGTYLSKIGGGSDYVMLYVRDTDGALVVKFSGTPDAQIKIRLRATAPYSNYGTV
jgi:hypothetical protein